MAPVYQTIINYFFAKVYYNNFIQQFTSIQIIKMGGCSCSCNQIANLSNENPIDPLQKQGDIIQNISNDPHIKLSQKNLQKVFVQYDTYGKKKKFKKIKNVKQIKAQFVTANEYQHKKYLDSIDKALRQNTLTSTNILSFMINQIADIREKQNVFNKFKNDKKQDIALRCFIYLYTGYYAYKKINETLRKSDYQKISKIIAVIKIQLNNFYQNHDRALKANIKHGQILQLHRGISQPDKKMKTGSQFYWKSFISTSIVQKIARNFGKFQYKIKLNTKSPHDYLIVPSQLSQFDEQQIILFPYFHFKCAYAVDYKNGALYQVQQIVQKD